MSKGFSINYKKIGNKQVMTFKTLKHSVTTLYIISCKQNKSDNYINVLKLNSKYSKTNRPDQSSNIIQLQTPLTATKGIRCKGLLLCTFRYRLVFVPTGTKLTTG